MRGSRVGQKSWLVRKTRRATSSTKSVSPPMSSGAAAAWAISETGLWRRNLVDIIIRPEQILCRVRLGPGLRTAESRTRVRYKETDQMGIAHHSNYIVWFEIGRPDLCRATGITYREIEEHGRLLVVVEVGCRYRTPFRYEDEVIIHTSVAEAGSRSMKFAYE